MKSSQRRKIQPDVVRAFGRRLRELRMQRGLSQIRLAAKAHVSLPFLGKLERAEAEPGLEMISRLAESLGVDITELIRGSAAPMDPIPALRAQARERFETCLRKAGQVELQTLAVLGSLLDSALSRNR